MAQSMLIQRISLTSYGIAISLTMVGCSAPSEDPVASVENTLQAYIPDGEFRIYPFQTTPNPCDPYRVILLSNYGGARATLMNHIDGGCGGTTEPNVRQYRLSHAYSECGSEYFRGARPLSDGRELTIVVGDHRRRTCGDPIRHRITVTEVDDEGDTGRYYSFDGHLPVQPGEFRLFEDPRVPGPCEIHRRLVLSNHDGEDRATISVEAAAGCDVDPRPRRYRLAVRQAPDCGTRFYNGSIRDAAGLTYEIFIADHRGRRCFDGAPRWIVIDETDPSGVGRTFYSAEGS